MNLRPESAAREGAEANRSAPSPEGHVRPGMARVSNGGHASQPSPARTALALDAQAIDVARRSLDADAVQTQQQPWQRDLIGLLNDALATELVCSLRYRRHHHTAQGLSSLPIGAELMRHARQESVHADRLAVRIVQLGGLPDFSPESLSRRSHAAYDDATELKAMLRADLIAERIAVESYTQLVALIGDRDPTTRRLIEDILGDEQAHAEEIQSWLIV